MKIISNILAVLSIMMFVLMFFIAALCSNTVAIASFIIYVCITLLYEYIEVNREDGEEDGESY